MQACSATTAPSRMMLSRTRTPCPTTASFPMLTFGPISIPHPLPSPPILSDREAKANHGG